MQFGTRRAVMLLLVAGLGRSAAAGMGIEAQPFDSAASAAAAGWTAFNNNAAAHPEGIPDGNFTDFGFSDTNLTGGTPQGEAGGRFNQRSFEETPALGYYADLTLPGGGTLDLSTPLSASGEGFAFFDDSTRRNSDPGPSPCGRGWLGTVGALVGFFNTADGPQFHTGFGNNFLGYRFHTQASLASPGTGKNIRVLPQITLADGSVRNGSTAQNIFFYPGPVATPDNQLGGTFDWRMDWDPTGGDAENGRLTLSVTNLQAGEFALDGAQDDVVLTADLRPDDSGIAEFDAFGLVSTASTGSPPGQCDQLIDFSIDDLRYGLAPPALPSDFDGNGVVDAADIDLLCDELGGTNADFDLNEDGMVNHLDADELILEILGTEYGDADLMGGATLGDLGTLAGNFTSTRTDFGWADGDFNWDGEVTLADLGILASNFGPNGPIPQAEFEAAVEAAFGMPMSDLVPEPAAGGLLLCCLGLLRRRR